MCLLGYVDEMRTELLIVGFKLTIKVIAKNMPVRAKVRTGIVIVYYTN